MRYRHKLKHLILYIILTCLLILIMWHPLCSFIDTILLPFLALLGDTEIVCILLFIPLVYLLFHKRIISEKELSDRIVSIILFLIALLFFEVINTTSKKEYNYFHFSFIGINYINAICLEIFFIEALFYGERKFGLVSTILKHIDKIYKWEKQNVIHSKEYTSFIPDHPTLEDKFERVHFADLLIGKIRASWENGILSKGAFSILLGESYGIGKTSFLELVKGECKNDDKLHYIQFRPWLCDDPEHMVNDFFNLLREEIGTDNKYLDKLLKTYASIVTEKISGNAISTFFSNWKTDSLEHLHDSITEEIRDSKVIYLITIDDVDRLQYTELISLIKLIRNSADFPNICYLVAADKNSIIHVLESDGAISDADLYLQKFFNYEMILPATEVGVLESIFNDTIQKAIAHLNFEKPAKGDYSSWITSRSIQLHDIFKTPRDIYRFVNILSFDLDALNSQLIKNTNGETKLGDIDICLADLIRLSVIRYFRPDLYKLLRDNTEDCLLDYRSLHEQLVIASNHEIVFKNRFSKRLSGREDVSSLELDLSGISPSTHTEESNDFFSLDDIVNKEKPSKDDIVKEMFVKLWSKDIELDDRPTINKNDEFFKYFSGRWRKDEATIFETKYHFFLEIENNKPSDAFTDWLQKCISEGKGLSIRHKLIEILKRDVEQTMKYNIIVNTLFCIDYYYKNNISKYTNKTLYSFYLDEWNVIIQNLISNDDDSKYDGYTKIKTLFESNNHIDICALFLYSVRLYHYSNSSKKEAKPCIISKEQLKNLSDIVIKKFFNEIFNVNPYAEDTIKMLPCIRLCDTPKWYSFFQNHITEFKDGNTWLYGLFYPVESGVIWNHFVVENLVGSGIGTIDSMIKLFDKYLSEEYKTCLKTIPEPDGLYSSIFKIESNKLLLDAIAWHKSGANPFSIPFQ